jgi:tRNA(Ile)-lysidine synthase
LALAILARDWARGHDGSVLALVVDHGLRPTSADEARITLGRLAGLGLPARLLPLTGLKHGSALAERARIMRYQVLADACRAAGVLHLLAGHHAADQVETLAMRVLRGSQTHGLAGMAALHETHGLRLLRPLLGVEPVLLRGLLVANGIDWVEDPSNRDLRAMRPRLRHRLGSLPTDDSGLSQAIAVVGRLRAHEEAATAAELADRVTIRPEGFALLSDGRISPAALGSLIRAIGGAPYPISPDQVDALAVRIGPTTLAGVRILPAGRFGDGWLIVREEAAVMPPMEASPDTTWDHRFRLLTSGTLPAGAMIGKLGPDAPRFRSDTDLPSAVLRTLPALRFGKVLAAVPHLSYVSNDNNERITALFSPRRPIAGPCFVPADTGMAVS